MKPLAGLLKSITGSGYTNRKRLQDPFPHPADVVQGGWAKGMG